MTATRTAREVAALLIGDARSRFLSARQTSWMRDAALGQPFSNGIHYIRNENGIGSAYTFTVMPNGRGLLKRVEQNG